jgi:hypothetical protein
MTNGWGTILAGLVRMFASETRLGNKNIATYAAMMILFSVGTFWTFKAYGREKE